LKVLKANLRKKTKAGFNYVPKSLTELIGAAAIEAALQQITLSFKSCPARPAALSQ
jgi:hypothetical protein